ncbi:LpqB family beta-propeller domain-containing protein [Nocardioides sp. 1609]|uniref:LpqB family beta-propeller domain-containing protein n=1 Tax=Nocardioides sp. 1609 TaxID=2508327 RepID=UPI001431170D|nr:LpqB family beta-propeller domain-containing protein [Nocardioides sp. 1609]
MLLALVCLLPVTACTGLPDSGPVVEAGTESQVNEREPDEVNAVPPVADATPDEIVLGFLKAMTAWPTDTEVVQQYLATSAAGEWDPGAATITYVGQPLPREDNLRFTLTLNDAERIGRDGVWAGRLPPEEQELALDLTIEDGQYRILDPPDALVVPDSWFAQRFQVASLYYFDPSGRILVPEPIYVPRGEQLTSTIIARLLAGPGPDQRRVMRSFVPPGLRVEVSVPVSADGVATVPLVGEAGVQTGESVERMLAQLAWTLRQDPTIDAVRVTLNDLVLAGPGGQEEYRVSDADRFDPAGSPATDGLFGIRNGALAERDGNELVPVVGPFGTGQLAIESATVDIAGDAAAGVTAGGSLLVVAPIVEPEEGVAVPVRRPLRGTDLLRPTWDFAGRIWTVDRTSRGAVVRVVSNGRARRLDVPGVSDRDVRSFLVSRDATRFVAVVREPAGDELRIGRIEVDDRGALDGVARTEQIAVESGSGIRIRDIAWTSPTTIALLSPLDPGAIYDVRVVSVDGSPASSEPLAGPLTDRVLGLAGTPVTGLPIYGLTRSGLIDLSDRSTYGFVGDPATGIGYAG